MLQRVQWVGRPIVKASWISGEERDDCGMRWGQKEATCLTFSAEINSHKVVVAAPCKAWSDGRPQHQRERAARKSLAASQQQHSNHRTRRALQCESLLVASTSPVAKKLSCDDGQRTQTHTNRRTYIGNPPQELSLGVPSPNIVPRAPRTPPQQRCLGPSPSPQKENPRAYRHRRCCCCCCCCYCC